MIKLDIKQLVDNKYKNLNQFAKAINISYPAAKKLYDGDTSRIEFDTLENICNALDCTPNDIFTFNNKQTSKKIIKVYHASPKKQDSYVHEENISSEVMQDIILHAMEKTLKEILDSNTTLNIQEDHGNSNNHTE